MYARVVTFWWVLVIVYAERPATYCKLRRLFFLFLFQKTQANGVSRENSRPALCIIIIITTTTAPRSSCSLNYRAMRWAGRGQGGLQHHRRCPGRVTRRTKNNKLFRWSKEDTSRVEQAIKRKKKSNSNSNVINEWTKVLQRNEKEQDVQIREPRGSLSSGISVRI